MQLSTVYCLPSTDRRRCSRIQADVKEGSHPMQGLCYLVLAVGLLALAAGAVFFGKARRLQTDATAERDQIARLREESEKEIEARKREAIIEAKDEAHRIRQEAEKEHRDRRTDLQRVESRLAQREETLDRRTEKLERREQEVQVAAAAADRTPAEAAQALARQREEVERSSAMTSEQARVVLLQQVEAEARQAA